MPVKHCMRLQPFALVGTLFILSVAGCRDQAKNSLNTETVSFSGEGTLSVYRAQSDSLLARLDIEFAETDYEIQTGLMYRERMEDQQGMLFLFPEERMHSFYMKNTLIPLDIIFIRSDLSIANIARNARPLDETGIPSAMPVQYVLEVKAGLSDRWGLQAGDRIEYQRNH